MNRRPQVLAAVMLFLTFLVGGLAGMALEEAAGLDWFDFLDEDSRAPEGRLLAGLELSDDQRERIAVILEQQEDSLEAFWEQRMGELQPIVAQSYHRVREVLSAEQRARFDARIRTEGIPLPEAD